MPTENERVVSEFCQTWTTLDIDKVMEFFTDDAVYHNIPLAAARGKAEIRKTIDGFMPGTTKVEFKILNTASVGATDAPFSATAPIREIPKTSTYTRAYADSIGFLTLLSDGERLTGAYALGPEAGEWLQQATLAVRAQVPIEVLRDTIQPFPTFSGIYADTIKALRKTMQ